MRHLLGRRDLGLSLGDCVCLTWQQFGAVAVTADRRWKVDGAVFGAHTIT